MEIRKSELEISPKAFDDQSLPGWETYRGSATPAALVRAQQRLELPWVLEKIRRHIGYRAQILDLGCGCGGVANALALRGHRVVGIDQNPEALNIAKIWDKTQSVQYRLGDIHKLPFSNKSFDVVVALDVFCRAEQCAEILQEASRVLKPGGIFIFNNFNRTARAWFLAAKGPEWFIKNTPAKYRVFSSFQKPRDFARNLRRCGLNPMQFSGLSPVIFQLPLLKLIFSGLVTDAFRFHFCRRPWLGYIGFAQKRRYSS